MTTRDEAFEHWWYHEGSQGPTAGNDLEEHCKRMCEIAWQNGAYKALEQAEQHPVAWVYPEFSEHLKRAGCWTAYANNGTGPYADGVKRIPVYFEPPQRKSMTELKEALVEAMSIINHYGMHGWSKAAHDEGERITKNARKALASHDIKEKP